MQHKYKSIKTWERIAKIKIVSPQYELDNLEDIEAKLKELEQENHVETVTHFGSMVINTGIQGVALYNSSPSSRTSLLILKQFDINVNHLQSLKSDSSKKEYVKQQMDQTINGLLKNWQDKLFLKEQKIKQLDQQQKKEKNNNIGKMKYFKWLKLKTKYEHLKNKLRQLVIDKLNDYENQMIALTTKGQFMLKNINIITTRNIFENMEKYGNSNEFHFLKSLGQDRINKIKERQSQKSLHKEEEIPQEEVYLWSKEAEGKFQSQRRRTKQLFTYEVSSSNWNDLGFLPILQQMALQEKKKTQREHILNKYDDGDFLTPMELQFLANTSELLNACLDRDFLQKSANLINPDLLSNMELSLAENILKDYAAMKEATMQGRLKYIREKMDRTKQKLQNTLKIQSKNEDFSVHMDANRKYIRMYTTVIHHMDRLNKFEEKIPDFQGAQLLKQYLYGRITDKDYIQQLKQLIFDKSKPQTNIDRNVEQRYSVISSKQSIKEQEQIKQSKTRKEYINQISRPKSTIGVRFVLNVKRHNYHPSTKVFLDQKTEDDEDDIFINPGHQQYNLLETEKFKLHLKSHPALKRSSNFVKFYSGGPVQNDNRYLYNNPQAVPSQTEIQAAVIIQRKLRALIRERKLKQKVEERRKQIYHFFKDSCDHLMNQARIDRPDEGIRNFMISKQLDKCKDIARDVLNYGKIDQRKLQTLTSIGTSTDGSLTKFCLDKNKVKVDYLFEAVSKNRYTMLIQTKFIYSAADINMTNQQGDTPLHIAVAKNNPDIVEWLLKNNADLHQQNKKLITPYSMAQENPKLMRVIQMYLK